MVSRLAFGATRATTRPTRPFSLRSTMPMTGTLWLPKDGRPRWPIRCRLPPWYISSISTVEPSSCRPSSDKRLRIWRNMRQGVAKFLRDALLGFHGSLNLLRDYWSLYLLSRDNCHCKIRDGQLIFSAGGQISVFG